MAINNNHRLWPVIIDYTIDGLWLSIAMIYHGSQSKHDQWSFQPYFQIFHDEPCSNYH